MRRFAAIVFAFALLLPTAIQAHENTPNYYHRECTFVQLVNDERIERGLQPLTISLSLTQAADHHARDMATTGHYKSDHTLSNGTTARQNIVNHGYPLRLPYSFGPGTPYYGEILIAGDRYYSAERAFQSFMASPPHKAIILGPNMKAIGVSRMQGAENVRYGWYWSGEFGGMKYETMSVCAT